MSLASLGIMARRTRKSTPFESGAIRFVGVKTVKFNSGSPVTDFSELDGGIGQAQAGDLWLSVATEVDNTAGVPGFGTNGSTTVITANLQNQRINDDRDNATRIDYGFVQTASTDELQYFTSLTRSRLCSILFFRNVDQTTPLDVSPVGYGVANNVKPNLPAITPATDEALILAVGTSSAPIGPRNFAAATDGSTLIHVDNYENSIDGRAFHGVFGRVWRTGDGAFDPAQFQFDDGTANRNDGASVGVTLALRPA